MADTYQRKQTRGRETEQTFSQASLKDSANACQHLQSALSHPPHSLICAKLTLQAIMSHYRWQEIQEFQISRIYWRKEEAFINDFHLWFKSMHRKRVQTLCFLPALENQLFGPFFGEAWFDTPPSVLHFHIGQIYSHLAFSPILNGTQEPLTRNIYIYLGNERL